MNKKLIAAALAVLLVALSFSACGKKKTITVPNGMEYEAVTDKDGNYVTNDRGDVAVYYKDANGKYQKDENGEKVTAYVDFPKEVVKDLSYETPYIRFTMPKEWENQKTTKEQPNVSGKYALKDHPEVKFSVENSSDLSEQNQMEDYIKMQLSGTDMANAMIQDAQKNAAQKDEASLTENEKKLMTLSEVKTQVTDKGLLYGRHCVEIKSVTLDKEGKTVGEQYLYFVENGTIMLRFYYVCNDVEMLGKMDPYQFITDTVTFKAFAEKETIPANVANK